MNRIGIGIGTVVAVAGLVCGCDEATSGVAAPAAPPAVPASVHAAASGYAISIFAKSSGDLRPDDLLQMGNTVFAVQQDPNNNPDGTAVAGTSPQSVVTQYDLAGKILQSYNVPGHPDGLAAFDSHTVWVSTNEDANPELIVIDTNTNTASAPLTLDTASLTGQCGSPAQPGLPHCGGLDDMKTINGIVYASASNPALGSPTAGTAYSTDSSGATALYGVNNGPVVYLLSLNTDGKTFHAQPLGSVMSGQTQVTLLPGTSQVTLNMTDADSSAIDPGGDLVVDSQQDSELVFIANIGEANQAVSVLPVTLFGNPWPLDDTRWSPASGTSFMLLADNPAQIIYRIDASAGFPASTPYSAGQGTLLQLNQATGALTPIFVGMNNPHGLIFVQ